MLSFSKILLLAGVIVAVLFGVRLMRQIRKPAAPPAKKTARDERNEPVAVDLEKCKVCGSYVDAGAGRCERPDCPRRG